MYSIKVEAHFSSAHNLGGYKGKCEELHGHSWKVGAEVASNKLNRIGLVVDFKYLKKELNKVLEKLDHKYLNNIAYFKKVNPTSENIARYIYDNLRAKIPNLKSITVWESYDSCASYSEE